MAKKYIKVKLDNGKVVPGNREFPPVQEIDLLAPAAEASGNIHVPAGSFDDIKEAATVVDEYDFDSPFVSDERNNMRIDDAKEEFIEVNTPVANNTSSSVDNISFDPVYEAFKSRIQTFVIGEVDKKYKGKYSPEFDLAGETYNTTELLDIWLPGIAVKTNYNFDRVADIIKTRMKRGEKIEPIQVNTGTSNNIGSGKNKNPRTGLKVAAGITVSALVGSLATYVIMKQQSCAPVSEFEFEIPENENQFGNYKYDINTIIAWAKTGEIENQEAYDYFMSLAINDLSQPSVAGLNYNNEMWISFAWRVSVGNFLSDEELDSSEYHELKAHMTEYCLKVGSEKAQQLLLRDMMKQIEYNQIISIDDYIKDLEMDKNPAKPEIDFIRYELIDIQYQELNQQRTKNIYGTAQWDLGNPEFGQEYADSYASMIFYANNEKLQFLKTEGILQGSVENGSSAINSYNGVAKSKSFTIILTDGTEYVAIGEPTEELMFGGLSYAEKQLLSVDADTLGFMLNNPKFKDYKINLDEIDLDCYLDLDDLQEAGLGMLGKANQTNISTSSNRLLDDGVTIDLLNKKPTIVSLPAYGTVKYIEESNTFVITSPVAAVAKYVKGAHKINTLNDKYNPLSKQYKGYVRSL